MYTPLSKTKNKQTQKQKNKKKQKEKNPEDVITQMKYSYKDNKTLCTSIIFSSVNRLQYRQKYKFHFRTT